MRSSPQQGKQPPLHSQHRRQRLHGGPQRPGDSEIRRATALLQHALPAFSPAARLPSGRALRPARLGQHGQFSRRGRRRDPRSHGRRLRQPPAEFTHQGAGEGSGRAVRQSAAERRQFDSVDGEEFGV